MRPLIVTSLMVLGLIALITACQPQITSFEECAAAGYPVMESYPRQCNAQGQTFVENVTSLPEIAYHECTQAEKDAKVCTAQYDPVCAIVDNGIRCITTPCPSTDAVTSSTGCTACASQAYGYYPGECEDQTFVVCTASEKGFDPEQYAKEQGGICVDICPGNYDSYVTQIGISLCIQHYGEDEIRYWQTCTRSSASCRCVKAYETTGGKQISDPKYRCVPETYAERMLFRGGLDSLDENGDQSVMIA